MNKEKRSSTNEMNIPGARQERLASSARGGGYQQICIQSDFEKKMDQNDETSIDELKKIGLPRHWIDIAETIGINAFIEVWRILSNCDNSEEKGYIYIPRYSSWVRFQRNRVILSLHANGMKPAEIQSKIKSDLRESITTGHIRRIIDINS